MKKLALIFTEMKNLIVTHKLYFLTPIVVSLLVIALLVIKLGPSVVLAFIYAGV